RPDTHSFPTPTLFRSPYIGQLAAGIPDGNRWTSWPVGPAGGQPPVGQLAEYIATPPGQTAGPGELHPPGTEALGHLADIGFMPRSEEHTSELQSRENL